MATECLFRECYAMWIESGMSPLICIQVGRLLRLNQKPTGTLHQVQKSIAKYYYYASGVPHSTSCCCYHCCYSFSSIHSDWLEDLSWPRPVFFFSEIAISQQPGIPVSERASEGMRKSHHPGKLARAIILQYTGDRLIVWVSSHGYGSSCTSSAGMAGVVCVWYWFV